MKTQDRPRIKRHVRTIWISDAHPGFPGCSADSLLDFIRDWPQAHNNVARSIPGKAKHDTRVIHVPGNDDEVMRDDDGLICRHIHCAELTGPDGVTYMNCGDWVERCTAPIEHHDGTLEQIRLADDAQVLERIEPLQPGLAA